MVGVRLVRLVMLPRSLRWYYHSLGRPDYREISITSAAPGHSTNITTLHTPILWLYHLWHYCLQFLLIILKQRRDEKKQFLFLFHPLSQPPQCCLASEVSSIFVRTGTRLLLVFRNISCSSGKTSPRLWIWIPRPHISRSRSMAFGTPFILGNFLIKGCWQYWDCCIPSVTGILSPPTWTYQPPLVRIIYKVCMLHSPRF